MVALECVLCVYGSWGWTRREKRTKCLEEMIQLFISELDKVRQGVLNYPLDQYQVNYSCYSTKPMINKVVQLMEKWLIKMLSE